MRIVGGEARGRRLRAPAGRGTRPTSDRVREAMFDILGSMTDVRGARVADLFAGSGALGIEALSRGAATAVLVDDDPAALRTARANLNAVGYGGGERGAVVRADAVSWARTHGGTDPAAGPEIVFADPPYRWAGWPALLEALAPWVDVLVAESATGLEAAPGWVLLRQRTYGATVVTVASPSRLKGGT